MTFKLDLSARHGAKLLNDFDVFTKIGDGDMVENNATTTA